MAYLVSLGRWVARTSLAMRHLDSLGSGSWDSHGECAPRFYQI